LCIAYGDSHKGCRVKKKRAGVCGALYLN